MIGNQVPGSVADRAEPLLANSGPFKLPRLLLERQLTGDEAGEGRRPVDTKSGVLLALEAFLLPSLDLRLIHELGTMHDALDLGNTVPIQLDKPANVVHDGLLDNCAEVVDPGL